VRPLSANRLPVVLSLAALLQSCASAPIVALPDMNDWETRRQVLETADYWQFSGRIAVSAGDEGFNGKFLWNQRNRNFSATVSGPLGVGTVRIEGDGRQVELTDKDGVKTRLNDVEADLRRHYGWTIPVASLRYWALGIPDPRREAVERLGDDGLLETLQQDGWQVHIEQYLETAGQPMPRRLSAYSVDTRVRLVIDRWLFF
jgi:outer membrane lipoprotein LolB